MGERMAIISKVAQQWHVTQTGEVKVCILGITMTSDSPKFLLLTVTCGLVSVTLVSRVSRAFLYKLLRTAFKLCSKLLPATPNATATTATTAPVTVTKMGQTMTVTTSVQLNTNGVEPESDLLASYDVIDLPRLHIHMRDAQTSPLPELTEGAERAERAEGTEGTEGVEEKHRDVGVGTEEVETQNRGSSPSFSFSLMFEEEEGGSPRNDSAVTLGAEDNSELYDKLGSIQTALQEANLEMDSYMSTLSEISQRHFCSPVQTARGYSSTAPFSASASVSASSASAFSADSSNVLAWEDEFCTATEGPSLPLRNFTTSFGRIRRLQPLVCNFEPEDLALVQSDLRFHSGLSSSYLTEDTETETDSRNCTYEPSESEHVGTVRGSGTLRDSGCTYEPSESEHVPTVRGSGTLRDSGCTYEPSESVHVRTVRARGVTRDSGCGDLWDATERSSQFVCSKCSRKEQRPSRPLSAPSSSGYLASRTSGALSCDVPSESSSSSRLCHESCFLSLSNDRVPKSKSFNKRN